MAIRCIRIHVSVIQISCVLINASLFVSSVCLEDIPSFIRSNKACEFRTVDFDIISNDSTKGCHIDCSILSTDPPSSHMDSVYRILTIEVNLLSVSNGFNLQTQCINSNPSLNVRIGCEGEFVHNRGIRKRCDSDTQCENSTTNSFCNETSGFCQCKAESLFLRESNTCSPVQRETDKIKPCHTWLVMAGGVAGLALGVTISTMIYLKMKNRNGSQIRCNKQLRKKAPVKVFRYEYHKPNVNKQDKDDMEGSDIYNHIHEPVNISVQPDYDHAPQHGVGDDDYSHMKTCNANQVDTCSSGEYALVR